MAEVDLRYREPAANATVHILLDVARLVQDSGISTPSLTSLWQLLLPLPTLVTSKMIMAGMAGGVKGGIQEGRKSPE